MTINQVRAVALIVKVALLASIGVYGLVAFVVTRQGALHATDPEVIRLMALVLGGTSVITLVLAHVLPGVGVRRAFDSVTLLRKIEATGAAGAEHAAARVAFAAHVVQLALSESVVIWGLVLTLMSGDLTWFLGFGAAGTISMLACRLPLDAAIDALRSAYPRAFAG